MSHLLLASASPRRRQLLEAAGFSLSILPSNVSEKIDENLTPEERVMALARRKARSVFEGLRNGTLSYAPGPKSLVAADTLVFLEDQVLEKPHDSQDAFRMLSSLSGTRHLVCTGVCIIDLETGHESCDVERAWVYFRPLSTSEIQSYIDSGEPFDKAGGYGIQGAGGGFISKLEGSMDTVMGLPVRLVEKMLIQSNYVRLHEDLKKSKIRTGVSAKLVAVSKLQPLWKIEFLYSLGQRIFAENYVQEALRKQEALSHLSEIQWHLIGPLQSKKINSILNRFSCLESVDRWELLEKMETKKSQTPASNAKQKIFLQVNLSGESTKSGFTKAQVLERISDFLKLQFHEIVGLMTLPPPHEGEKFFKELKDLRDTLQSMGLVSTTELSMGTSEDYPVALACGSTEVRVGEALLGPRGASERIGKTTAEGTVENN